MVFLDPNATYEIYKEGDWWHIRGLPIASRERHKAVKMLAIELGYTVDAGYYPQTAEGPNHFKLKGEMA